MNRTYILDAGATLFHADCRDALRALPDNCIDSGVMDPPYALVSIVKRFGSPNAAPAKGNDAYMRASAGFMGKQWDTGECAMDPGFWAEVLRVLKPGAHLVAFGASRGYHRMACAIVTPPGGTVLDPFAGSGTNGIAARAKGFNVVLCEREAEYVGDILRRFGHIESPSIVPEIVADTVAV